MSDHANFARRPDARALIVVMAGLALAGCAQKPTAEETKVFADAEAETLMRASKEQREAADRLDLLGQAAFWSAEYEKHPNDAEAALKYARVLRIMGNQSRALEVASQALSLKPGDLELTLVFTQAALSSGRPEAAVGPLLQAESGNAGDWRLMSLIGVTLDALEKHTEAQGYYNQALALSPDNPKVLSNLGLSQALIGEPATAEATLRKAVALPGADSRVYQNLALVLGVQGKFAEAEKTLRKVAPNELVESNLAYYRNLLAPGRSWDALRDTRASNG